MVPKKKKVSLWFIILGAILSGYAGYLLNGAWEPGGDINSFLESFNNVCAAPFANYYNERTIKAIVIALMVYAVALLMYVTKTLKATVRKAVESLQQQCQKMKQQLFEIKTEVKAKASEIVAEAKAKGKAALHKVSEFLGIKDKLESVRENVRKSIAETEHTINKLDAFGSGMREAGQKIANTFRTFVDKETVDYSEKEKKFSKTELVKKPFEAKKKLYQRMEQHLDEALDKVESLAKEPERMKDVEMAEPSMLGAVAEPEFQYGAEAFEAYQQSAKAETVVMPEVKTSEIKNKSR